MQRHADLETARTISRADRRHAGLGARRPDRVRV